MAATVSRRWTKRGLLELQKQGPREVARELLPDIRERLARNRVLSFEEQASQPRPGVIATSQFHHPLWSSPPPPRAVQRLLDNLQILHDDTHRLCTQIEDNFDQTTDHVLLSTLKELRARHAGTVEHVATIVIQWLRAHGSDWKGPVESFLRHRYSLLLLCDACVKRFANKPFLAEHSLPTVVEDAALEAKLLVEGYYEEAPPVHVVGDASAVIYEPWLAYVWTELFKNAMQKTLDQQDELVPIVVDLSSDPWTVCDSAGPVTRLPNLQFAQTERLWDRLDDQTTYAMVRSPLQGLGVGLSLSRLVLEHFGGRLDVTKNSDEGLKVLIHWNTELDVQERLD